MHNGFTTVTSGDVPDITTISDICDAIRICEEYRIPCDGFDHIDDFIEILRCHFMKRSNTESRKVQIEKSMLLAADEDANRRQKLAAVMSDLLHIIQREGSTMKQKHTSLMVEDFLRIDGTSDHLEKDCQERITGMQEHECLVLVAGETSAGKSSVLNLLLEDDILPQDTRSSTSVITVLRYGTTKRARVVSKTNQPDLVFDLDKAGMERLKEMLFMKDSKQREHHNIKEVELRLPSSILKSGLVLVDSPGIGENEFFEAELTNFIANNKIHGFIYVIKTDNAGGIQEDRLLSLMNIVLDLKQHRGQHIKGERQTVFDPKAAIFVCNRYDLIAECDKDAIKKNALVKLSSCWPSFDPSQVVFFSTTKAKIAFAADSFYINDSYKVLLDRLKGMFICIINNRVHTLFRWIENVMARLSHHLKTVVKRLDISDKKLNEESNKISQKLERLKHKSQLVLMEEQKKLELSSQRIHQIVKNHLMSERGMNGCVSGWREAELPILSSEHLDWTWIKRKIHELFFDKVMAVVDSFEVNEGEIEKIEQELAFQIKFKLQLLEDELGKIEKEIHGDGSSSRESDADGSRRRSSVSILSPSNTFNMKPNLPHKIIARIIVPIFDVVSSIKNRFKLKEYMNDPVTTAQEYAMKMYRELINEPDSKQSVLTLLTDYLLERARNYIAAVERNIPDMILSNHLLINHLVESIEIEKQHQTEYEEMMTMIESLRRSLKEYGQGCIFVDDFSREEVQIHKITCSGDTVSVPFNVSDFLSSTADDLDMSKRRDSRGIWSVTYGGHLVRHALVTPVAIRVYLPCSGVNYTFKEVAKLRCLSWQPNYIAEFLGIHNTEAIVPAFVYNGLLKSARRFLNYFCNKRSCVPIILEQTASGLQYLHAKGLVHMELTQDTLTVDEDGIVRLTGACLPRIAKLPADTTWPAKTFVYLAPEVLRGEIYDSSSDIYSFGLLVLELATICLPMVFVKEQNAALCDFIRNVNPQIMLKINEAVAAFTVKTKALVSNCLEIDKHCRPSIKDVVEYTSYIKNEDALLLLSSRKARKPIKRGDSCTRL